MTTLTGQNRNAFTLTEFIGVLAILVILACLVLPRITKRVNPAGRVAAVQDARVADTLIALQSLKTAAQARSARFGTLGPTTGSESGDPYDTLLLRETFLDRPFTSKVGPRSRVRILNGSGLAATARVLDAPGAYDLDGDGSNDIVRERYVVEVMLFGVTDADAKALNDHLDGPALGADAQGNDLRGQVVWNGSPPDALREVHIYVARGR